mmetsp:Transcript_4899/g.12443  ORF Transcript_4899/g.12443 Transcript_4899/m.12443 type:complete len:304 (+) Transcript_4899:1177-2088(+)
MNGGIEFSNAADHGVRSARIAALFDARCVRAIMISRISAFTSGMYSMRPSGMRTTPNRFPSEARYVTISASSETIAARLMRFASISSPMSVMLGCVRLAHSSAMCDGERPMMRTKYQCFRTDAASVARFPTSEAYTRHAVSLPMHASQSYKSPSIDAGTPMIRVGSCCAAKWSASIAVSELETDPPMSTSPCRPSFAHAASTCASCSAPRSTSAVRPSSCIPPVLTYVATSSLVISRASQLHSPRVPLRKPTSRAPLPARCSKKWWRPATTLCAPGHCRPQNTTPIVRLGGTSIPEPAVVERR